MISPWYQPANRDSHRLHTWLTGGTARALTAALTFDFLCTDYGAAYGVTPAARARLLWQSRRIVRSIPSGAAALTHLLLMCEVLTIPPTLAGVVVECGVWKGASSATLSLACQRTNRRLLVCDSFAGLPAVADPLYLAPHSGIYGYLEPGMFRGTLAEVQQNIARFGSLAVCDFVRGFFAESLGQISQPVVFAFLDVDLPASFQSCLQALWPRMVEGGVVYVDDVGCMNVAQIFFDEGWWQAAIGCQAPGLVGSGCGLPIHPVAANIGYTRKLTTLATAHWRQDPHLAYPTTQPGLPNRKEEA